MEKEDKFRPRTPEERKEYMKTRAFKFQMVVVILLVVAFATTIAYQLLEGLGLWKH